jgi:hypothetical protein
MICLWANRLAPFGWTVIVEPGSHLFRSSFVGFQMLPSIKTLGVSVS